MIRSAPDPLASANCRPWKMDLTGVACLAAVTLGAYLLQIQPAIRHRELARSQSIELSSAKARAQKLEHEVQTTRDQLSATRRAASQASLALQPPSAMNQRLAQLTELAGANRLAIDAIEAGALGPPSGTPAAAVGQRHTVVPIRVSGRGDYRRFQGFLHLLRQNLPDLAVASFDLTATGLVSDIERDAGANDTPAANRNPGPTASFVLDLVWFTQPAAAQPGPWADGK